jgi:AcrR family transcriptional regulator
MESKEEFLEFAISKFLRYGSKRFSLDDLAHEIGISKKTIYQHFTNKEALVYESLGFLLDKIKVEVSQSVEQVRSNPLLGIIMIDKIGLEYLKLFSPTFLDGIKKYYPMVNEQYHNFKNREINNLVLSLLKTAQKNGQIRDQSKKLCVN